MITYLFSDGRYCTSKLDGVELNKRMRRLDLLRVMTEGYESGVGYGICQKALRAYKKTENFTGIVRLTTVEKDFLSYLMDGHDGEYLNALRYYCWGVKE
nr:MAG TPA: hypothetical protein [Caudoviricetes sp.]